jgi:FkbM family methyltransferase
MDGSDALRFRRVLPNAAIFALEPNPRNFALMQADERLQRRSIRMLPLAATDRDSEAPFFVVDAEYEAPFVLDARVAKGNLARRGMSSLHRRDERTRIKEVVRVHTVRLDGLLGVERASDSVALWVDTEGMAFEAIAGAAGVLGRTVLIHVEVETVQCFGENQRLFSDVEKVLVDAGFALLATDHPVTMPQFNALFVRAESLRAKAGEIRWHVARGHWYRSMKRAVRPFVPPRLWRFLASRVAVAHGP